MGESVVNAPDVQNKMGGSVNPHGALEVSISFGRFENDSLSWEKWSTFSPNKYLEEVEKCSTPGSVAQKKAYFEAHYKKIAARKAELLEQEKMMRTDSSRPNELNSTDCSTSSSGTDAERGILNGQSFAEEVELETNSPSEVSSSLVNESAEADRNGNALECQNSLVESADVELNEKLQFEEVNYPEKADLITEEILKISEGGQDTVEKPLKMGTETMSMVKGQEEKSELKAHNTDQKTKEQNSALYMNKKQVLPPTKSTGLSTSTNPRLPMSMSTSTARSSKPASTSTPRSSKPVSTSTPKSSKPVSTSAPRSSKLVSTSAPRSSKPVSTSAPRSSKPVSTSTPRSSKVVSTSTPRSSKPVPTSTPRSSKSVPTSTLRSSKSGSAATSGLSKPLSTSSPTLSKSVLTSAPRLSRPASASTSRLSKPVSNPIVRPVSQSSTRKLNVSSSGSKISSRAEIRLAAPTAFSKSLDAVSFSPSRQSFIMEQMGDKDIVKRAFKSFQNNLNQLQPSRVENPCGQRPISARGSSEHEASSSVTSQKENERTRKATGKMNAQKILVGTKWSTTSSRSLVETEAGIYMKPNSFSSGPISEERAEKRKAFLKNLEEKSYAREEEKRRLSSKQKMVQEPVENNIGQQC